MQNDLFDLEIGVRYRHNKTGVVFELTAANRNAATLTGPDGKSINVPPGVLDNLYSIVEPAESVGILPIGSISIEFDGPTPPPALGSSDELDELPFKRSGRPRVERPSIDSYFGEPRKLGPRRKEDE